MNVEFFDREDSQNPLNGSIITEKSRLLELLDQLQDRSPFFCELLGQNGYIILLGIGGPRGCVQHSSLDGRPPYLMAVSQDPQPLEQYIDFFIGGTASPVPSRYCPPFDTVKDIAAYFQMTGERSPAVSWEEI
jgi:Immunity protein Imm1